MQIYNCFCCIFVSLIIVGATEFIAAVHLLYNVLSFYTCQTGQFFEFNEIIYYMCDIWIEINTIYERKHLQCL